MNKIDNFKNQLLNNFSNTHSFQPHVTKLTNINTNKNKINNLN